MAVLATYWGGYTSKSCYNNQGAFILQPIKIPQIAIPQILKIPQKGRSIYQQNGQRTRANGKRTSSNSRNTLIADSSGKRAVFLVPKKPPVAPAANASANAINAAMFIPLKAAT